MMPKASGPVSTRKVIRLIWEADSYPILGNEDIPVSRRLMAAAMAEIGMAVPSVDDPPEFALWLAVLQRAGASLEEREDVIWAIHDFFRAEEKSITREAALAEMSALDQELKLPQ